MQLRITSLLPISHIEVGLLLSKGASLNSKPTHRFLTNINIFLARCKIKNLLLFRLPMLLGYFTSICHKRMELSSFIINNNMI